MDRPNGGRAVMRLVLQLFFEGLPLCLVLTGVLWFLLG
jgi:hypothetical protein